MKLTNIEQYTAEQIELASQASSAIKRYLQILSQSELPEIYQLRHKAWVECALAQLFNTHSAEEICAHWSEQTDIIIKKYWEELSLKLPNQLALFALGKWGAFELNLSSDIDIIITSLKPPTAEDYAFLRIFKKTLTEHTSFGFCYRVDIDLRPGGRLGPFITSVHQMEDYYWSQGSTWERIALLRLRPICGLPEVLKSISEMAIKFSYRKFLDFRIIDEISQLRALIHSQKEVSPQGKISLKFHKGGIRDIEFYVNVLQLIHGGKDKSLQTHSTDLALTRLGEKNILPISDIKTLKKTYWSLRRLENITQITSDSQTHLWPSSHGHSLNDVCNMKELEDLCKPTQEIIEAGIQPPKNEIEPLPSVDKQEEWLRKLGFSEHSIKETWGQLIKTQIHSRTKLDDRRRFEQFLMQFTIELYKHGVDKDLGLSLLKDFISSTRAKSSFFILLLRNEKLLKNIAQLFSSSPYLGGIIASRPELLDNFIFKVIEHDTKNLDNLLGQLAEQKLLSEVINTNQFLSEPDVKILCEHLTYTADNICESLLEALHNEYGLSQLKILCLGKWGGQELGLKSDLDFIFLTPQTPTELDHKIAKRFISRLRDQHKGGNIYNIDLRLRPSGNSGPLLSTYEQLQEYLNTKAAAWERQAYLKSRWLNSEGFNVYNFIGPKSFDKKELEELKDIRLKLLNKFPDQNSIDIKYCLGGLIDIEFCTQISLLNSGLTCESPKTEEQIELLAEQIDSWKTAAPKLTHAYNEFRKLEQYYQSTSSLSGSNISFVSDAGLRLSQILKKPSDVLHEYYSDLLKETAELIKNIDPIYKTNSN